MSLEQEKAFQGLKEVFKYIHPQVNQQSIKLNFDIYKNNKALEITARIQNTDIEIVMIHVGPEFDWSPGVDFISSSNIYSVSKAINYLQDLINGEKGKRTDSTVFMEDELNNIYMKINDDYGTHGDRDNS